MFSHNFSNITLFSYRLPSTLYVILAILSLKLCVTKQVVVVTFCTFVNPTVRRRFATAVLNRLSSNMNKNIHVDVCQFIFFRKIKLSSIIIEVIGVWKYIIYLWYIELYLHHEFTEPATSSFLVSMIEQGLGFCFWYWFVMCFSFYKFFNCLWILEMITLRFTAHNAFYFSLL